MRALTSAPGPLARPVVAVLPAQAARVEPLPTAGRGTLPAYSDAEGAARALAHAATRADWLARLPGELPTLPDVETTRAKDLVSAYLETHPEGGWLEPQTTAVRLGCYGIRQIPWVIWSPGSATG